MLLDRSSSTESGTARLIYDARGEEPVEHRLYWRSAEVWRFENSHGHCICDGASIYANIQGTAASGPVESRRGWPAWHLQLVFPLRAHVWGRLGDDCYLADAAEEGQLLRVTLAGTQDDRAGSLLVEPSTGYIHEADYNGNRLTLRDLKTGPHRDVLFIA
jgi:hypothetical protein